MTISTHSEIFHPLLTIKKKFFFSSFQTDYANSKITQETEFFFKSKGSVVLSGRSLIDIYKIFSALIKITN